MTAPIYGGKISLHQVSIGNMLEGGVFVSGERSIFDIEHINKAYADEVYVDAYSCLQCGARIMMEHSAPEISLLDRDAPRATACLYCNEQVQISEELLSGNSLPSRVIPFVITRDRAFEILQERTKNILFLPGTVKSQFNAKDLKSVYIPFKLCNIDCSTNLVTESKTTLRWGDYKYDYVKTETSEMERSSDIALTQVPINASGTLNREEVQKFKPHYIPDLVRFSKKHLSGHFIEAPTADWGKIQDNLVKILRRPAEQKTLRTVGKYDSTSLKSSNFEVAITSSEYVMVPV